MIELLEKLLNCAIEEPRRLTPAQQRLAPGVKIKLVSNPKVTGVVQDVTDFYEKYPGMINMRGKRFVKWDIPIGPEKNITGSTVSIDAIVPALEE